MIITTVAAQRSGTKLLAQMLGGGGSILSLGEIFNPDSSHAFAFSNYLQGISHRDQRELGSSAIIDKYLESLLSIRKVVHFDIMFNQLEFCCRFWNEWGFPFIYNYLKSRKALVLYLKRSPRDIFLSQRVLNVSNVAHAFDKRAHTAVKLSLSKKELIDFSTSYHREVALLRTCMKNNRYYSEIRYDDIVGGVLPPNILTLISRWSNELGMEILQTSIQGAPPDVQKANREVIVDWT